MQDSIENAVSNLTKKTDEDICKLHQLIKDNNPLLFLGHTSYASMFISHGECDPSFLPRHIVYLANIILQYTPQKNWNLPHAEPSTIQSIFDLMKEIMQNSSVLLAVSSNQINLTSSTHQILFSQKLQNLHITGKGYHCYRKEIFLSISSELKFSNINKSHVSGNQLSNFIDDVALLFQYKIEKLKKEIEELKSIKNDIEKFKERAEVLLNGEFQTDVFDITSLKEVYPNIFKEFYIDVSLISPKIFNHIEVRPGLERPFLFKPILKINSKYYLFTYSSFEDNLFTFYHEYIKNINDKWAEKYRKARDNYVEYRSFEIIRDVLQASATSWKNLSYEYEEAGDKRIGETDGIVFVDGILFIIEAKAHQLRPSSQRGAPKSFPEQIDNIIGKADQQAERFINILRTQGEINLFNNKGIHQVTLRSKEVHDIKKIIVIYEDLSPHLAQLHLLYETEWISASNWPWVIAIHDLMAICHIITYPAIFLLYLQRRIDLNKYPDLKFHDEMEIFGYFISKGLFFEREKKEQPCREIFIGMAQELDVYFSDMTKSKPHYPIPKRLQDFIEKLAQQRPFRWLETSCSLLSFDDENLKKIDEMILLSEMYYYQHRFIFNTIICKKSKEVIVFTCMPHTHLGLSSVIDKINLRSNDYLEQQIRVLVWQPPFEIEKILIFYIQGGEKINISSMYLNSLLR